LLRPEERNHTKEEIKKATWLDCMEEEVAALKGKMQKLEQQTTLTDQHLKKIVSENHRKLGALQNHIEAQEDVMVKNEKETAKCDLELERIAVEITRLHAEADRVRGQKEALASGSRVARAAAEMSRQERIQLETMVTRQRKPLLEAKVRQGWEMEELRRQLQEKNERIRNLLHTGIDENRCLFSWLTVQILSSFSM